MEEEVTLQCDASQSGLGAALLQNGQPVAYASRALSPAETHYAQIEKELLAIVFACDHFEAYVYGRDSVQVETDHQPLVTIVQKPLNSALNRLQRMLLRLQKYNLHLKYKRGKLMFLADTLSRAHPNEVSVCEFSQQLEEIDHTMALAMPEERLQQLAHSSTHDPVLQVLRETITRGWPATKSEVSDSIRAYYDYRDQRRGVFRGGARGARAPPSASNPVLINSILGTTGSTAGLFNGSSTSVLSNPACIRYLLTYYVLESRHRRDRDRHRQPSISARLHLY